MKTSRHGSALTVLALACPFLAGGAEAQPQPSIGEAAALEVPGGDIFGFTAPTDVGDPGDRGIAFELTSALGKRIGAYRMHTLKTELSATVAPNVALAFSPFVTGHHIRRLPGLDDRSRIAFDGFSAEVFYRFVERSPANPIAMTVAVEPRYARIDDLTGERALGLSTEFKLLTDAVLVPQRLYGALNLVYEVGAQRVEEPFGSIWERGSGITLSAALAYQASERFFVGVEARHLSAFSGAFLNRFEGQALFVGPTALIQLTERAALNVAWTPQLAGRAAGLSGGRDLENFTRHQVRVKFASSF